MSPRSFRFGLYFALILGLLLIQLRTNSYAQDPIQKVDLSQTGIVDMVSFPAHTFAEIVYSQPPNPDGGLFQSSWWHPNESSFDHYLWDNFTLESNQTITEIQWRGGYDPDRFGSGGPVFDFTVAIYGSIAAGIEPDVINPPLVEYRTNGNAGEIPAGDFGGVRMFDYKFVLPMPFHTLAGTKYWLYIVAPQHGMPDWGIMAGTGGDGIHFLRIHQDADIYKLLPGDAAFKLLGSSIATLTPTPTGTQTPTPTATHPILLTPFFIPIISR